MIINCRPSSPRKTRVFWRAEEKETISVGRRNIVIKAMVTKVKEFNTWADADGFARGLQNRGIFVEEIQ